MSHENCTQGAPKQDDRTIDVLIGERIRFRREDLDLSRAQLASALEIPESDLADIESGKQRAGPKLLGSAAHVLGISVHWFFSDRAE
jgi:transcriptional regulator with XRE-family HTH domain